MDEREMQIKDLESQLKYVKREYKAKLNKAKALLRTVLSLLEFESEEWRPYWVDLHSILGSELRGTGGLHNLDQEVRRLEKQIEQLKEKEQ